MPYSLADENACLQAGYVVDGITKECCTPDKDTCYTLEGFAAAYQQTQPQQSQWVQYVPTLADTTLDILGFFGLGSRPTQPIQTQQQQRRNYAPWIILGVVLLLAIILYFVLKKKK